MSDSRKRTFKIHPDKERVVGAPVIATDLEEDTSEDEHYTETDSLLDQNDDIDYDDTIYDGNYGPYNKDRTFSHALQIALEGSIDNLMTFLTWFPQMVASIGFIFLFPMVAVAINFFRTMGKILLNPLMDWKHKTFFISAITTATTLIMAPLTSNFFLEFLKIGFIGFKMIAPFAPFLFTGAMGIFTALNAYRTVMEALDLIKNSHKRTSLALLSLSSKIVKTTALATITSLIIPLFLTLGAITLFSNPFTAGPAAAIMFTLIMAASATLITMKIVKTIAKHRLQEKMAYDALEGIKNKRGKVTQEPFNPYEKMGIPQISKPGTSTISVASILSKQRRLIPSDTRIARVINNIFSYFANQRELKLELDNRYVVAQNAINGNDDLTQEQKNDELYKLQLSYEMLKHPRGREMFDAFKAVKDLSESGKPMPDLATRQNQFGVFSGLQKTIPFSWLMRPIAAAVYALKSTSENPQEHALSYRLATNKALSDYYQQKLNERSEAAHGTINNNLEQSNNDNNNDDHLRRQQRPAITPAQAIPGRGHQPASPLPSAQRPASAPIPIRSMTPSSAASSSSSQSSSPATVKKRSALGYSSSETRHSDSDDEKTPSSLGFSPYVLSLGNSSSSLGSKGSPTLFPAYPNTDETVNASRRAQPGYGKFRNN